MTQPIAVPGKGYALITEPEKVEQVCKIGQREACCRYLTMTPTVGFTCEKHTNGKAIIDQKVTDGTYTSAGDNCEGVKPGG